MQRFLDKYLPVFQMPDAGGGGGDSGSSASSPSASSSTPTSTSPSSDSDPTLGSVAAEPESLDFNSIFEFSEDGDVAGVSQPGQPPVQPTAPQPEPPKPAPAAQPQAPVSEVQEVAPGQTAPAPAAVGTPTSTSEASQLDPHDPVQIAQFLEQNGAQAIEHAAANVFKLSDQEIEALEQNPAEAIPKLLAKTFVHAQYNMLMQFGRMLPNMIQRTTQAQLRHRENEDKFFTRWPQIDATKHRDIVNQLGAVYRQMNPQATLEQMVEDLGPFVMMKLGIRPDAMPAAPQGQRPAPGSRVQPTPFQPAGPVGGGAAKTVPQEMDPVSAVFTQGWDT